MHRIEQVRVSAASRLNKVLKYVGTSEYLRKPRARPDMLTKGVNREIVRVMQGKLS